MAVNLQAVPGTGLVITPDNSGNMTFSTGLGTGNVAMTINAGNNSVSVATLATSSNLSVSNISVASTVTFGDTRSLPRPRAWDLVTGSSTVT